MEIGTVHQIDIDEQMRAAYLDYAMSVMSGSIEQLIVSPVRPVELIAGKLTPYVCFAMLDMMLIIGVAYKWGRLYCGWLCPHFSVVETINQLMRRAIGRQSLWDHHPRRKRTPTAQSPAPTRSTGWCCCRW